MERKQNLGFFSALKHELIRGLTPSYGGGGVGGGGGGSPMLAFLRRRPKQLTNVDTSVTRSASFSLTPLYEGFDEHGSDPGELKRVGSGVGRWMKSQICRAPSGCKSRSDLRLLLGVMGAPLAPVHVSVADTWPHLSIKDTPIETSSAQYILQQYTAASGCYKPITNAYAMGKVKMVASELEATSRAVKTKNASGSAATGGFVLWQMNPDMWYVELAVGGSKVQAGCNGDLVWRHTPWLGAHTAKGPVRPLRRTLQGLDPRTTARMFTDAKCVGEKKINGEDCFILKLAADPETLKTRSEGPAEIIRHVLFGYFSQKTGLIIHMEDSHLTRIQTAGNEAVYWETTISSSMDDYKPVEGVMIAHSGHSVVTLFRFGEMAMSHTKTRMEEAWSIEEVAFNVPGLSIDCFIPPSDLKAASFTELPEDERGRSGALVGGHGAKVAALV